MIPVAFDLRDPDRSGIARVARSLARAFVEIAANRFHVTLAGPPDVLDRLGAASWGGGGTRIVPWSAGRYSISAERQWGRVRRDVGPAIWYFPHWDVPWHGQPERYAVTVHDVGHLQIPGIPWHRRALARRWIRRATAASRVVLADTRFTSDQLAHYWPSLRDKTEILSAGVDPVFFSAAEPLPDRIVGALHGAPYMLSVGIRKRHKNLAVGVEILASNPGIRWVVVGESFPEWNEVMAMAHERGVATRMIVLERESDVVLHSLYQSAACLVFPSRYEGFGLPILEALAAGTPVVVGNAAASVETLGGHGRVCDVDDAPSFARAVTETLVRGERASEAARAHARSYSWKRSATALVDVFQEIDAVG